MTTKAKVGLGLLGMLGGFAALLVAFGSEGKNEAFQPQNEFKLEDWVSIELGSVNMSITRAVLYLVLAAIATTVSMVYVANRMQAKPNRIQTAVELLYSMMRDQIVRNNMDESMARKWFPRIAALFLFIWFSNVIGYIPLPSNTEHKTNIFGADVPTFGIYAATANISVTLVLALIFCGAYHVEGIRAKGPIKYLKGWVPKGVEGPAAIPIFGIEVISHFVRIISLSVRLFANILAGHLLILFMGGGLVVLLGLAALGAITLPVAIVFFLFEIVLIATLQAFIFATLASIYLGEAVADGH